MKSKYFLITSFLLITQMLMAQEEKDRSTLEAEWDQGVTIKSSDDRFQVSFGGRLLNDWVFFQPDEGVEDWFGSNMNGTEVRRARLYNEGKLYGGSMEYKLQFDFAGGDVDVKDVYLKFPDLPVVGNLRIGHMKEQVGFEILMSSNNLMLTERSYTSVFIPERNTGVLLERALLQERLTLAAGIFKEAGAYGEAVGDHDKYNVSGRITGLPYFQPESNRLLHLGLSGQYRNPPNRTVAFSSEPETHILDRPFAWTPYMGGVETQIITGGELAFMFGPFSLQSEYVFTSFEQSLSSATISHQYSAFYAQASIFLTGENRVYKQGNAEFGNVTPDANFGQGGPGAFELAVRYSGLDLEDDGNIAGRKMNGLTGGLNWYPNPNTKLMVNYVHNTLKDVGNTGIWQLRAQVMF